MKEFAPSILALLCLVMLAVSPALAQQRTSLSELGNELSGIVEAICEKADVDGNDFRPKVCAPRCDCIDAPLSAELTADAVSCVGSVPGTVTAQAQVPAHDALCTGVCINGNFPVGFCTTNTDCPVDSACWFSIPYLPGGNGLCADPVVDPFAPTHCFQDAHCTPGLTCDVDSGACVIAGATGCPSLVPATPQVCGTVAAHPVAILKLAGLDDTDSSAVVQCIDAAGTTKINSHDGLACRDQIEVLTGLDCP
jgi:hypothetical protein